MIEGEIRGNYNYKLTNSIFILSTVVLVKLGDWGTSRK